MNVLPNVYICQFGKKKNAQPLSEGVGVTCTGLYHSRFTEDTNWNKQKWCFHQSKTFTGISDIVRCLKTLRINSNEIPVLLLILAMMMIFWFSADAFRVFF